MGKKEACDKCKQNCLLIHGRKKDPCPVVTTFHKILFGVYDYSKDLCLPQKISQTIPLLVAGQVYVLEDTNGQQWQVTLGHKDGHLAFRMGWDKFFADHGLREGYTLAFHYIINSHFFVQIIDNTGFEKLRFPVANGQKRKRIKVDVKTNAVGECQNLDSEARIHSQPMSKVEFSSLENGNGPDGTSDKRNLDSSMSAKCNAVESIIDENPVSAKVVNGEPPAKVVNGEPLLLSNNNNVYSRENFAQVVNDDHGDHQSVLPRENRAQLHSECRIESSTKTVKRAKIEEAAVSKKHSGEIMKLPESELKNSEKYPKFKERSGKVVKTGPVISLNEEGPDASAFSITVMVGSSELLELPTSVALGREKKVVSLKGSDERVWPVLYQHKLGIKALTSGWKNFFMSYRLRIGDECALILENEAETIFRIDVKSK